MYVYYGKNSSDDYMIVNTSEQQVSIHTLLVQLITLLCLGDHSREYGVPAC